MLRNQKTPGNSLNLIKPAAAATTQPPPVSMTVPPIPPMGRRSIGPLRLFCEEIDWPREAAPTVTYLEEQYSKMVCGKSRSLVTDIAGADDGGAVAPGTDPLLQHVRQPV